MAKMSLGAEEMAHLFRALALTEDLVPSTHMAGSSQRPVTSSLGDLMGSDDLSIY